MKRMCHSGVFSAAEKKSETSSNFSGFLGRFCVWVHWKRLPHNPIYVAKASGLIQTTNLKLIAAAATEAGHAVGRFIQPNIFVSAPV